MRSGTVRAEAGVEVLEWEYRCFSSLTEDAVR